MSDSDGKKTLGLRGGARPGNVKQSLSHGRTKNVVVETKRKRGVVPKPGGQKPTGPGAGPIGDPKKRPAGITDAEMECRLKAVQAMDEKAADLLAKIGKTDTDLGVRLAAVEKITDMELLNDIFLNDTEDVVRQSAAKRLNPIYRAMIN